MAFNQKTIFKWVPIAIALVIVITVGWLQIRFFNKKETVKEGSAMKQESWEDQNKDFLIKNKEKEDVQITASGLQYKILRKGDGKKPANASVTVEVHYKGTLIDGKEFDSSYKRNQTASFALNQVISGWTEGLQLMNEGAMYEFYIPQELGYGGRNVGGSIPAFSTLIFQVELIKIL